MTTAPIWQRVYKGFRQFGRSKGGNITITFAFASIPLFGMAGAALDYSRANSARTAMQAAVDSAALMLSKDAQTLSTTALNQKGTAYFTALLTRPDLTNITVATTYSRV